MEDIMKDAYKFEEGKTYMVEVLTDNKKKIFEVKEYLDYFSPKIKWIVVPKGVIRPVPKADYISKEDVKGKVRELMDFLNIAEMLEGGIYKTLSNGKEDKNLKKYTNKVVEYVTDIIKEEVEEIFEDLK